MVEFYDTLHTSPLEKEKKSCKLRGFCDADIAGISLVGMRTPDRDGEAFTPYVDVAFEDGAISVGLWAPDGNSHTFVYNEIKKVWEKK